MMQRKGQFWAKWCFAPEPKSDRSTRSVGPPLSLPPLTTPNKLLTTMPHTVEQPPLPAVPDYPTASPYDRQVEAAHRRFLTELEVAPEEWTEMGERQGVRLSKRYDEDVRPNSSL